MKTFSQAGIYHRICGLSMIHFSNCISMNKEIHNDLNDKEIPDDGRFDSVAAELKSISLNTFLSLAINGYHTT